MNKNNEMTALLEYFDLVRLLTKSIAHQNVSKGLTPYQHT